MAGSSSLITKIDRAFDLAVGYDGGLQDLSAAERRRRRKGKARAVVPDDEEDEQVEMDQVASVGLPPQGSSTFRGGSFPETSNAGGGGFMLDEPQENAFIQPGGFSLVDGSLPTTFGGGFLPMDTDSNDLGTGGGGGGGGGGGFFAADDSQPNSFDFSAPSLASAPGGFFAPPTEHDTLPTEDPHFANATFAAGRGGGGGGGGGFLPELPPLDFATTDLDSLTLPTPPRPNRISLARIPEALRNLGVPRGSEREVMEMFEEVASDDENFDGEKSVKRERFREALEVLLAEEGEGEDGGDADESNEDEYVGDGGPESRRRRSTRTATRRSTRANPVQDSEGDGEAELKELDFAGDAVSSDSDASPDPSEEEEEDEAEDVATGTTRNRKTKKTSKNKKPKYNPRSRLSKDKIAAASDSFDLFFEGSAQLAMPQTDRKIGLAELQRACRVLKEKFTDDDLTEMLEFAADGQGAVGLESFARILAENRL